MVIRGLAARVVGILALAGSLASPVLARDSDLESAFDRTFAAIAVPPPTIVVPAPVSRATVSPAAPSLAPQSLAAVLQSRPVAVQPPRTAFYAAPVPQRFAVPDLRAPLRSWSDPLQSAIAAMASPGLGRIGVAAMDLDSGRMVTVLGDQAFPLASTSKIAIAATFLQGVDEGRFRLTDQFPLMVALPSRKLSSSVAPVRAGTMLSALSLIELSITRSDNAATDALLAAIGGPQAVNRWLAGAGVQGFRIDRDIATLVRDDGLVDPAHAIDPRDSTTPAAMVRLLAGLQRGEWLSGQSRAVLLGAMGRCETGKTRMRGQLPADAQVAHKTGTLANTASDVGIIRTPDGRELAVAIYVTGQGGKPARAARIAAITRALYDGYFGQSYGAVSLR